MGFAAETNDLIENATAKLHKKNLDCIVANWVGDGLGFDTDEHEVVVLTKTAEHALSKTHKVRLAGQLVAILAASLQNNEHLCSEISKTNETCYST